MPFTTLNTIKHWFQHDLPELHNAMDLKTDGIRALNLGCGKRSLDGFLNVDLIAGPGVDRVVDLEQKLPFDDEIFDLVVADNVFEHIENYLTLMQECSRILRPGGTLIVDVPYFKSAGAFIDPTHCNFFTLRSMNYFVPNTYESKNYDYIPILFSKLNILVNPIRRHVGLNLVSFIANKRPEWIEKTILSAILQINSVRFLMTK